MRRRLPVRFTVMFSVIATGVVMTSLVCSCASDDGSGPAPDIATAGLDATGPDALPGGGDVSPLADAGRLEPPGEHRSRHHYVSRRPV